ncbi:mycothiol transferase [Sphaerisporangium perillae]
MRQEAGRRGQAGETEDTVRHAGHMDILRELIDGATGDHPPD